jgi:hypothetical protein
MRILKDFSKENRKKIRITKSHILKHGLISITYVTRNFEKNTVATPNTIIVKKIGGAKTSLLNYIA